MIPFKSMHWRKPALVVLLALLGTVATFAAIGTLSAAAPNSSAAPSQAAAAARGASAAAASGLPYIALPGVDGVSVDGCPAPYVCQPPAPASVLIADCCKKGTRTYEGKYDFCYCQPDKIASVCKFGLGHEKYPLLKEDRWCVMLQGHPYWPGYKVNCTQ